MADHQESDEEIDRFILDQIDTVPHLEALLLLWRIRPEPRTTSDIERSLFVKPAEARSILQDLARKRLIQASSEGSGIWRYVSEPAADRLMNMLDLTYRRELIRITRMIHGKPSAAIRHFADAFRLKKERD